MLDLKHLRGDTVVITNDTCMHGFEIGSKIVIDSLKDWGNGHFSYVGVDDYGDRMLFDDDDCEGFAQ